MKKILFGAMAALVFVACEPEKHYSYAPVFKGFQAVSVYADQIPLMQLKADDSIKVSAVQEKVGDGLYHAEYNWEVSFYNDQTGKTRLLGKQSPTVVYDYDKSDPSIRFRVPDTTGTIKITFSAEYQYSSASYIDVSGSQGGITVGPGSSLMNRASGRKEYRVVR